MTAGSHERNSRQHLRAILALGAAFAIKGSVGAHAEIDGLAGTYVAVTWRAASDVATTIASQEADPAKTLVGKEMRFGNGVNWIDGRRCEARLKQDQSSAARVEPNLSDLQIVPGRNDHRINQTAVVDFSGGASGDIWEVLIIDDRVFAARAGINYLILERPLTPDEGLQLQRGLRRAGLDPGAVDGNVDETTRSAVAEYARQHGAAYRFSAGVVTRNILDAVSREGAN
jgi:hypothetical protein